MPEKATYLGDGVYATFDGYHIWLYTESESGVHEIALEPPVYQNLQAFASKFFGAS